MYFSCCYCALLFCGIFALVSPSWCITFHQEDYERDAAGQRDRGGATKEKWNYVKVRPGAHMFWWLYYTQSSQGWENVPLILWLQGGPGGSSTGFGNFLEIGPLNVKLDKRNTTWLSRANLLFVDNPVGTGYSYVDNPNAYCTDIDCIGNDLVTLMKNLLAKQLKPFQKIPFYIFSESYGGKMTAVFSKYLYQAMRQGLPVNFQGLAMGDSWIAPSFYVSSWAPYLYTNSLIGLPAYTRLMTISRSVEQAIRNKQYAKATALWSQAEDEVEASTNGVNFYNILKWQAGEKSEKMLEMAEGIEDEAWRRLYKRHVGYTVNDELSELMNGFIRDKLAIIPKNVTWGGQSEAVFTAQRVEFMKPVIDTVDYLLKNTSLKVVVYNGQLDLICDTLGTEGWIGTSLTWPGLAEYYKAERRPMTDGSGVTVGFYRRYKQFSFYWILNAGHMIPQDAGNTALMMVEHVVGQI